MTLLLAFFFAETMFLAALGLSVQLTESSILLQLAGHFRCDVHL